MDEKTMMLTGSAQDSAIKLLWHEAELLDRKDYNGWLNLWATTGHYVIPIDPTCTDFEATLNYVFDDDAMRRMRAERMTGGYSASASDAARTVRTVSRFVFEESVERDDIVTVRSSQVVVACKRGITTLFAADLTHRILLGEKPVIVDKVVRLIDSEDALNSIGFLL